MLLLFFSTLPLSISILQLQSLLELIPDHRILNYAVLSYQVFAGLLLGSMCILQSASQTLFLFGRLIQSLGCMSVWKTRHLLRENCQFSLYRHGHAQIPKTMHPEGITDMQNYTGRHDEAWYGAARCFLQRFLIQFALTLSSAFAKSRIMIIQTVKIMLAQLKALWLSLSCKVSNSQM